MKKILAFVLLALCHLALAQSQKCGDTTNNYLTDVISSYVANLGIDHAEGKCYFFNEDGGTELYFLLSMLPEPALSLGAGEDTLENLLGSQIQTTAYPNLTGWRLDAVTGNGSAVLVYGTPEYVAKLLGWEKEEFEIPNVYQLVYILNVEL